MARVTGDGKVLSSGKGFKGAGIAWTLLDVWITKTVPRHAARLRAIRRK